MHSIFPRSFDYENCIFLAHNKRTLWLNIWLIILGSSTEMERLGWQEARRRERERTYFGPAGIDIGRPSFLPSFHCSLSYSLKKETPESRCGRQGRERQSLFQVSVCVYSLLGPGEPADGWLGNWRKTSPSPLCCPSVPAVQCLVYCTYVYMYMYTCRGSERSNILHQRKEEEDRWIALEAAAHSGFIQVPRYVVCSSHQPARVND